MWIITVKMPSFHLSQRSETTIRVVTIFLNIKRTLEILKRTESVALLSWMYVKTGFL